MKKFNRQLYTTFYDCIACFEYLNRETGPLLNVDDIITTIKTPIQWIAEGTVMYFSEYLLEPLLNSLSDSDDKQLKGTTNFFEMIIFQA